MLTAPIRALQLLSDWELREHTRQRLIAYIGVMRRWGLLDAANSLSEHLRCLETNQPPSDLRGFPVQKAPLRHMDGCCE